MTIRFYPEATGESHAESSKGSRCRFPEEYCSAIFHDQLVPGYDDAGNLLGSAWLRPAVTLDQVWRVVQTGVGSFGVPNVTLQLDDGTELGDAAGTYLYCCRPDFRTYALKVEPPATPPVPAAGDDALRRNKREVAMSGNSRQARKDVAKRVRDRLADQPLYKKGGGQ